MGGGGGGGGGRRPQKGRARAAARWRAPAEAKQHSLSAAEPLVNLAVACAREGLKHCQWIEETTVGVH